MLESGYLTEVFSSIQGEGIYIGQRHTFLRFAGCNIRCAGCDTPAAFEPQPEEYAFYEHDGEPWLLGNPENASLVVMDCRQLGNRVVVLTGGEPLCQPEFTYSTLDALNNSGFSTYLETNGTLPDAYALIRGMPEVVAMDIKLPSFTGLEPMWDVHAAFLNAARHDGVFVKVVITSETTVDEIVTAAGVVGGVSRDIPMVIQPVGGFGQVSMEHIITLHNAALGVLPDVRVIPQIHKLMGIR